MPLKTLSSRHPNANGMSASPSSRLHDPARLHNSVPKRTIRTSLQLFPSPPDPLLCASSPLCCGPPPPPTLQGSVAILGVKCAAGSARDSRRMRSRSVDPSVPRAGSHHLTSLPAHYRLVSRDLAAPRSRRCWRRLQQRRPPISPSSTRRRQRGRCRRPAAAAAAPAAVEASAGPHSAPRAS